MAYGTSLIEAVNYVLLAMREGPISSLEDPFSEEASIALARINQISRELQSRGWWFNRESDRTLVPTSEDEIVVGEDVMRIEIDWTKTSRSTFPVLRGPKLFDSKNATYSFTASVYASTLVRELHWDFIPEDARTYIKKKAARELSSQLVASQPAAQAAAYPEQEALDALEAEELRMGNHNIYSSPSLYEIQERSS